MKFKIEEGTIDLTELKRTLKEEFGDRYKVSKRSTPVVVLGKTKIIGATVSIRKDKLHITGNFPALWVGVVFTFSMVLLGIIVPLLLYFLFLHKKLNACEKEIAAFIKEAFAENILEKSVVS